MQLSFLLLYLSLFSSDCVPCNYFIDPTLIPSAITFNSLSLFFDYFPNIIGGGLRSPCDNITISLTNSQIYPISYSATLRYELEVAIPIFFINYANESETALFPVIQFQSYNINFSSFSNISFSNLIIDVTNYDSSVSSPLLFTNSSITYENLTFSSENQSQLSAVMLASIIDSNITFQNVKIFNINMTDSSEQLFYIFNSNITINNILLQNSIFPDNFTIMYMVPQSFSVEGLNIISNSFGDNTLIFESGILSLEFNVNNFNFINNTAGNLGFYSYQGNDTGNNVNGPCKIFNSNISSNVWSFSIPSSQSNIMAFFYLSYISFLSNITISNNLVSYGTLFRFSKSSDAMSQLINLANISFTNNFNFYPFIWIDTTNTSVFQNVTFYQDSNFLDTFPNAQSDSFFQINGPTQITGGCIVLENVQNIDLTQIIFENYLSYNQPLIRVSYETEFDIYSDSDEFSSLTLNMTECVIINSTIVTNPLNIGSVIYISLEVPGNVTINASIFGSNLLYAASLAQQTGVAINIDAPMANLRITKSQFEYNMSPLKSVISTDVYLLNILTSRFINNTSINAPFMQQKIAKLMRKFQVNQTVSFANHLNNGMALYIQAVNSIIDRCDFSNNIASNGGAIYVSSIEGGNLTISNSNFNDNMAYSVGGAIVISNYMEAQSNTFINNCFFSGNQASSQGGSITFQALSGSNLTVSNSTFTNGSAGYGNYFYLEHMLSWVTIINSSFIENDPIPNTMRGGSISINSGEGANVRTVGCQFINITSGISTGTEASIVTVSQGSYIDNSSLFSNITYGVNGIIFISGNSSIFYSSNFSWCNFNIDVGIVGDVGILLLDYQTTAKVFHATFFKNNIVYQQAPCFSCPVATSILLKASSSIFIYASNFTSNVGFNGSCILALVGSNASSSSSSIIMQNSFVNNSVQYGGGAILINSGNFDFLDNSFISNMALKGGAIFLDNRLQLNYSLSISQNTFSNNTAKKGGGAILIDSWVPSTLQNFVQANSFINNTSFDSDSAYGANISLFSSNISLTEIIHNNSNYTPIQLSNISNISTIILSNTTNSTIYFIPNQTMATFYNFSFVITLLDALNEPVTIDNQTQIHLSISLTDPNQTAPAILPTNSSPAIYSNVSLNSNSKATASNGVVNYKTINITSTPNTNITLTFSLSNINNYYQSSFIVLAYFRTCIPGEILAMNGNTIYCYQCPLNSYSFINDSQACEVCPVNGYCKGGSFYQVPPGYWRYYLDSNLTQCLNPSACQGDIQTDENLSGNDLCSPGYTGGLCGACDMTQNYMKTGSTICSECFSVGYNILLLGVWILAYFGCITIFIKKTIDANKDFIVTPENERDQFEKAGFYLKILTNYIQVLTLLRNFELSIPAPWSFSNYASDPIYAMFPSFGCLTGKFLSYKTYFAEVVAATFIFPVCEILLICVIWSVAFKFKRFPSLNRENLILAIFFVLSFGQVLCVNDLIGFSLCSTYDNVDYVFSELAVYCDDDYLFFRWLYLIPMLVVWMILFPFGIWLALYINKDQMKKPSWRGRFGYFYNSYKDEYYYWEFLKMILKSGIAALSLWTGLDIKTKIMTSIFLLMMMGLETHRIQPSRNKKINEIDVTSWVVLALTFFFAYYGYNPSYEIIQYVSYYGIVFALNFYFLVIIFGALFVYMRKMLKEIKRRFGSFRASKASDSLKNTRSMSANSIVFVANKPLSEPFIKKLSTSKLSGELSGIQVL